MANEELVIKYDQLIHKFKSQLCVLRTFRKLVQSMEDETSSNIDLLNSIIEKLPD